MPKIKLEVHLFIMLSRLQVRSYHIRFNNLSDLEIASTSLMTYYFSDLIEMVLFLLRNGANINLKNDSGETALALAVRLGNFE